MISRLLDRVKRDLEDEDHDDRVKRGELHEDTRILREPCPMPNECRWVNGTCQTCGKRDGVSVETRQLQMLAIARRGGMPVARADLPFASWLALGLLEQKQTAEMMMASMVGRM